MGTDRQIRLKELLFSPSDNESATPDQVVRANYSFRAAFRRRWSAG